jgi:hypothetical protein
MFAGFFFVFFKDFLEYILEDFFRFILFESIKCLIHERGEERESCEMHCFEEKTLILS